MEPSQSEQGVGFLILILVLFGLGLTASVLTVSVRLAFDEQATATTQRRMRLIADQVSGTQFQNAAGLARHYEQDVGTLPTALGDLLSKPAAIATCGMNSSAQLLTGWCGPYWNGSYTGENIFSDGWGNSLTISTSPRQIRSRGPNGIDNSGTSDDIVQPY